MDIPTVVVRLAKGTSLRGKTVFGRENLRPVYEFQGVPYAQPPVGSRRFQPPAPLQLWTGERPAKKFGPVCPQEVSQFAENLVLPDGPPTNLSEDCLYLNVYTPTLGPRAALPVMFWIHGGAFVFGSGDIYRGTGICSHHDVVMVSINYRLGVLGFLTTGDDVAPGNYGLLDQIEALRWVQKYIRAFGGDPDNVTIFGESAGGMSVSMLMMSDLTRGLFRRCIAQSGTANMPGFLYTKQRAGNYVRKKLSKTGFTSSDSQEIIRHLRSVSPDELIKTLGDMFRPVIDGHVIEDTMTRRYSQSSGVAPVEFLLGCNTHEAFTILSMNLKNIEVKDREMTRQIVTSASRAMGVVSDQTKAEQFAKLVMEAYFSGVKDGDERGLMEGLVDFYGDCLFVTAVDETARLHSRLSPTYFYYFTQRPSFSVSPKWVDTDHAMDILFMLGFPQTRVKLPFTEEERQFSQIMMAYWVNFARTGNPNGAGLPHWPQFTEPQREYLNLKARPSVGTRLREHREKFWRQDALPFMLPCLISKY